MERLGNGLDSEETEECKRKRNCKEKKLVGDVKGRRKKEERTEKKEWWNEDVELQRAS